MHWPAGLKTKAGSITAQPAHVIDVLPTLLELAEQQYPKSYEGHELTSLDGASLLPILEGEQRPPHAELFFEHEDGRVARQARGRDQGGHASLPVVVMSGRMASARAFAEAS